MDSVRSLELLHGSSICPFLERGWSVPPSSVYTKYACVMGEPPWVDFFQNG